MLPVARLPWTHDRANAPGRVRHVTDLPGYHVDVGMGHRLAGSESVIDSDRETLRSGLPNQQTSRASRESSSCSGSERWKMLST